MKKFFHNFAINIALLGSLFAVLYLATPLFIQPVFEMLLGIFEPWQLLLFALFIALPKRI